MLKKILSTCFLFFYLISHSQFQTISVGPSFDEPKEGYANILQLKNGNTIFFLINLKSGIDLRLYDSSHKEKIVTRIVPSYGKLKKGSIKSIFEVNGDAVLLISELDGATPVLYRLIIDGNEGKLKEETTIASLIRYTGGNGYGVNLGYLAEPDFFVNKDPYTDHYSVVLFNSFEVDRNKRIEVILYGPDNKPTSRAYFNSPDERYKYLTYMDMTIVNGDKVYVLVYAYNTKSFGGKSSKLVVGVLKTGSNISISEFENTKDRKFDYGLIKYNPIRAKITMLASANQDDEGSKGLYNTFLSTIDTSQIKEENWTPLSTIKVPKNQATPLDNFTGLPQDLHINSDGSISIIFQELVNLALQRKNEITGFPEWDYRTMQGCIVVADYTKELQFEKSYFIPNNQPVLEQILPYAHSARKGSPKMLLNENQYKSFMYLNSPTNKYVLFNEPIDNSTAIYGRVPFMKSYETDGYFYNLSSQTTTPTRNVLFEQPEKNSHHPVMFSVSGYDSNKNIFATVKFQKEGRSSTSRLVWLQPL